MACCTGTGRPSISAAGGNSPFCPSSHGSARTQAPSARTMRSPETVRRRSSHTHPQPVQAKFSTTRATQSWRNRSLPAEQRAEPRVAGAADRQAAAVVQDRDAVLALVELDARQAIQVQHERSVDPHELRRVERRLQLARASAPSNTLSPRTGSRRSRPAPARSRSSRPAARARAGRRGRGSVRRSPARSARSRPAPEPAPSRPRPARSRARAIAAASRSALNGFSR